MQQGDLLSQFIHYLAPHSEVFARVKACAPWGIKEGKQDVCAFTYVLNGPCYLLVQGHPVRQLKPGQLLLLAKGTAHSVASSPDASCEDVDSLFGNKTRQQIEQMVLGGCGEPTEILCGYIRFPSHNLQLPDLFTATLPEILILDAPADCRLGQLLRWIHAENAQEQPGQALVMEKLLQVLLVEILRALGQFELNPGLLRAMHDRHLAPALLAFVSNVAHQWQLDELAAIAALSRSAFTRRFRCLTGQSCQTFIRHWRCLKAADMLSASQVSVRSIAEQCGFQSSDVFIRNFRQYSGLPPQQFRTSFVAHVV
ncbi:AraC family transcriptional regulator [Bowmanella sp. Y26]|uniref:AraC family transcriptional regulator n=1 Tax=Bowmanella yangjiangensis TaxID=2811230 RepID=UPI001BDC8D0B|nr:AraC family transcriptional regulator [Bowmanella yangjiangensis]MBT1064709.1 AraC family transcriptional regulator [Bowmanella yangjiangensis]